MKNECEISIVMKRDGVIKYSYEIKAPSPILAWELITKLLKHDKDVSCTKFQLSGSYLSEI